MAPLYPFTMELSFTTNQDSMSKNTTSTTTTLPSQSMNTISNCKFTEPSTCAPSMENGVDDQAKPESVLGAERMKKHWKEVSVRGVVIPETWGKEDFLKDWTQSTIFDALIARKRVDAARQALIAEKQKTRAASVRELQV